MTGPLRPDDEQVGAAPAQAVLALDAAAAVHHALQERLQQELRAGLLVVEARDPVLGVLAEEGLEGGKQLDDIQSAVGVDVPRQFLDQPLLGRRGQLARHYFGVDGIGDAERDISGNEAEVADVLDVARGEIAFFPAAQQGLDDALHAILLQLVRQLVEMRLAALDDPLLRTPNVVGGDWTAAVTPGFVPETGLVRQRVHQPRLAAGPLPDRFQRRGCELLPRLTGVLREQRRYVVPGEVAQAHRTGLDVEGAAAGNHCLFRAGTDAVVADVPHPAQHDALREAGGAPHVSGPQLAQHRQQRVADEDVDLIHQQYQRFRIGLGPARQRLAQPTRRTVLRQDAGPGLVQEAVAQRRSGPGSQRAENRPHRRFDVLAHRLRGLDVDVDAPVVAFPAGVEQVPQGQQGGRLPRLPRRVEHEVAFGTDQVENVAQIQTVEGRDAVVLGRDDGTGRIEEARHAPVSHAPSAWAPVALGGKRSPLRVTAHASRTC